MNSYQETFDFASQYLVAGVSSAVRLSKAFGHPFYTVRGDGSRLQGIDGKEYIDLCMSHGASFLGHNNPKIVEAIKNALELGIICSHETKFHSEYAKQICDMVPCCELVRFTCSGSDATQHALRVAREFTRKEKVIQFEGCFHGYHEGVMFSTHPTLKEAGPYEKPNAVPTSGGIPEAIKNLVYILPYNDVDVLEKTIKKHRDEIAAIIVEPVGYNSGCMLAKREFIKSLRELTTENDVLLIFDEILSGFRMCVGGAQEYFNTTPDLCTLGKAIAGGTPLSVFGGKKEIMQHVKPLGRVQHSGTYNGHLFSIMAGLASLDQISSPGFYDHINNLAARLYSGFNEILQKHKIKGIIQGLGGLFGIYFGLEKEPRNYRDIAENMSSDKLMKFYKEAFKQGLYFADYGGGPAHHGFSSMHTTDDIEECLDKIDIAVSKIS
ncbi:MAG: aminotransferase class III-fold pyridoxal phosphate-dependent enzyme [Spirochaetaceae bacterium]|nr:MAG: aminotransferase class III-fold pyridoxal phosphate-dependent enzyme [Spirochaetaceae bacterium]